MKWIVVSFVFFGFLITSAAAFNWPGWILLLILSIGGIGGNVVYIVYELKNPRNHGL